MRGNRRFDVSRDRATFGTPVLDVVHQRIDPLREDAGLAKRYESTSNSPDRRRARYRLR